MQTFHGSRADLVKILRTLPQALSGGPDPYGISRSIQLRAGVTLLSKIQQAFRVKSQGGTGEDGITWDKLKRATIAQRRTSGRERKALGITGKRTRGLLTPAEDKKWRAIFASRLAKLRMVLSEGEAKAQAAQIAWAILKSGGAQTKLQVLGGRTVDIGRDTSRMYRSLTPGSGETRSGEAEQIFEIPPGWVIVGSNVPYFPAFHKKRPVWPPDGSLPQSWADAIAKSIQRGCVAAIVFLSTRGNP